MSERLVRDTASQMGRNIFVRLGGSSMREVSLSYARILFGVRRQVSFVNEGQETGCVRGEGVVLLDPSYVG